MKHYLDKKILDFRQYDSSFVFENDFVLQKLLLFLHHLMFSFNARKLETY
jgi:hypothetical protein